MPPTDKQPTQENIINELRALRPTPSEEFSAELDAWAAAGFPRVSDLRPEDERAEMPEGRLGGWLRRLRERPLLPAAAGAATVVMVVAIAVSVSLDGRQSGEELGLESADDARLSEDSGGSGAGDQVDPAPSAPDEVNESLRIGDQAVEPATTTAPPAPTPPDEELKPGQERFQERSAAMTLSTEPDEVDDVADGVVEVTERYDGIVVSSNVSTGGERGRASFDLRIPTANLQATLADLSDLASVSSRDEGTLDITAPFVTAEERFKDAKAEVDALLEELAEADSESEIAAIREQLQVARAELAAARSELGGLKQRADFSRLSLTVVGNGDADGWSLGDAVDDAVSVLEDLAGAGLVTLAVIVPLGALALAAWYGLGALRRRRRERALDD